MSSPIEKPLHFPLRPVRLEGESDPVPAARLAEAPPGAEASSSAAAQAEPGDGRFLARGPYELIRPRGVVPNGFDAAAVGA